MSCMIGANKRVLDPFDKDRVIHRESNVDLMAIWNVDEKNPTLRLQLIRGTMISLRRMCLLYGCRFL